MTRRFSFCCLLATRSSAEVSESRENRAPPTSPVPAGEEVRRRRRFSAPRQHALVRLLRTGRLSPVMLAFWLGGAGMGTGGSLLGALMPYQRPVAVANSMLWWGIYFGAFGASVCALAVLLTERAPPRPQGLRVIPGVVPPRVTQYNFPDTNADGRASCPGRNSSARAAGLMPVLQSQTLMGGQNG